MNLLLSIWAFGEIFTASTPNGTFRTFENHGNKHTRVLPTWLEIDNKVFQFWGPSFIT
ncbi:predicted protein [Sclerotinia sclerotiorum 1980 UF-70]|uniref:Uncharacterized protein n=1 Tax=Sclerotinia sclerotiorum (strain ATCC 18683 / 1980 / Ss-1) TaxID=665079 RepID=A7F5D2_SCLS1|nr:predicted protein [Sclerotinia sclerotiorum 1980 UF-70]EDN97953.1 predicted protein [Sclerotinia sclerotiorum 1980 UF-70]